MHLLLLLVLLIVFPSLTSYYHRIFQTQHNAKLFTVMSNSCSTYYMFL
jgi:hypothetical protein